MPGPIAETMSRMSLNGSDPVAPDVKSEDTSAFSGSEHSSRTFSWEPCALRVKHGDSDGQRDFVCNGEWPDDYEFRVDLSRMLTWDLSKEEWRWHKTWRLPDIVVKANAARLGIGVEARVTIVCAGANGNELTDAGIITTDQKRPDAALQLVDGTCRFTRLRLVGTSSTHGGRRFHILVSLVRDDGEGGQTKHALASLISTAFSVYSRKNADKKRKREETRRPGEWSEGYDFIPFDPSEFTRDFVKKTNDHHGHTTEESIDNSWEGLLRYFQAPNIRFKCRHPLFLAVRFSNVLIILRDKFRWPDPSSEDTIRSFVCSCGFPLNCIKDDPVSIGHGEFLPPWLIALRKEVLTECPPAALKKLKDSLSVIKGPALGFLPDPSILPKRYTQTDNVDKMKTVYSKLFDMEFSTKRRVPSEASCRMQKKRRITAKGDSTGMSSETENADNTSEVGSLGHIPTSVDGDVAEEVREYFQGYFKSLHNELRQLLSSLVEYATVVVTSPTEEHVQNLKHAYEDFTEALAVHAYIEDNILFPELSKRVPHVAESYMFDHDQERGRLTEIQSLMSSASPQRFADLFLKISEFAALHKAHMEKEEGHLLPYFTKVFNNQEIVNLVGSSAEKKINLLNARHSAAINAAIEQAQMFERDHGYPPQSILTGHTKASREKPSVAM